ncbi:MAG: hypothetical protein JXM70_26910 [Pirellulales bacterium]|nr:hypothetical protein [Pirellulales bacterium]
MVQATETATLEHDIQTPDASNDISTGELVLRICSPARQGQIVRLRSRKCTIGSARNCTLRLNARGVQPVHCLIVRGVDSTVIRCWNSDTRINGRSFTDANLNFGDRLSIGPIEFEVLNTSMPPVEAEEESHRQLEPWQLEQDTQERERLNAEAESLRQDRERFESEMEAFRRDQEQFKAEIKSLRQDRECLDSEKEALRQDRERFHAETESLRKECEDREAERGKNEALSSEEIGHLEQGRRELESQRADFERQVEQWENARESEQQRLRQATEEIESRTSELKQQQETLQRQREEWEVERNETERRLNEQSADIDRREASLMDRCMELDEARSASECEDAEISLCPEELSMDTPEESSGSTEVSIEAPVSLGDTLERMGVNLVDDDPIQPEKQEQMDVAPRPEQVRSSKPVEDTEDDGEESLDSYMARLMDRVRNVSSPSGSTAVSASTPVRHSGGTSRTGASENKKVQSNEFQPAQKIDYAETAKTDKLEKIMPRGVAPEREMSLSSMRELANVSAHTAINRHAKRQYRHAARSKLLVTGIGLISGAILMSIWWLSGERGLIFHAGMAAFMVALFWGFQFAVMSGKVLATNVDAECLAKIMVDDEETPQNKGQEATDVSTDSSSQGRKTTSNTASELQNEQ